MFAHEILGSFVKQSRFPTSDVELHRQVSGEVHFWERMCFVVLVLYEAVFDYMAMALQIIRDRMQVARVFTCVG